MSSRASVRPTSIESHPGGRHGPDGRDPVHLARRVLEAPGGGEDYKYGGWTFKIDRRDEGSQFKLDETMRSAALLLGRRTYEGFAAAWPERDGEFADKKRLQLSSATVVGDGVAIQVYTRS